MARRTATKPAAPQGADSHDLIRVQGARENNLKDISVELPKRRLTVFTGVFRARFKVARVWGSYTLRARSTRTHQTATTSYHVHKR